MYVVCVTVLVKPDRIGDFKKATLAPETLVTSLATPGSMSCKPKKTPPGFFLYEVYKTREGFKSHQQSEHYLKWKATVADWMAQPRQGVKHNSVFPADPDW